MPVFADGPVFSIDLSTATGAASIISAGIMGAARMLVGYFRQRDIDRDKFSEAVEKAHREEITRLITETVRQGDDFRRTVSEIQRDQKAFQEQLINLQKKVAGAIERGTIFLNQANPPIR